MTLKSFCLGCRHEKHDKNEEPCVTVCQARTLYIQLLDDPTTPIPDHFRRGHDIITFDELQSSIEKPVSFRRKLNKLFEPDSDPRPSRSRPKNKFENPQRFSYKLNREGQVPEGYKYCPDCPMDENPRPLSEFLKQKNGFRGRTGRCKKHHKAKYYKYKQKEKEPV